MSAIVVVMSIVGAAAFGLAAYKFLVVSHVSAKLRGYEIIDDDKGPPSEIQSHPLDYQQQNALISLGSDEDDDNDIELQGINGTENIIKRTPQ